MLLSFPPKTVTWVIFPEPTRRTFSLRTWHGTSAALGGGEGRATISEAGGAVSCCHIRSSSGAVTQEEVRPGANSFSHVWDNGEIVVFGAPDLNV